MAAYISPSLYRPNRAFLKTIPAVQAMFLHNLIWPARFDTSLGTVCHTLAAADAILRDIITFFCNIGISHDITFPEDRIHTEIEIFNLRIFYTKDNADLPCIVWVNIG